MPIRVLSEEVASKIAAGEVVERPASVVKELVENSIDAGAREIKIEVRRGGRRLMRVIDDGTGIPADEVELAFARHATSKIASVEELSSIATLGFRGEALASIAAVSQLTIVTRAAEEDVGTLLRLEGGKVTHRQKKGCPQGTVVTVENLFYNVPARLKFLRTETTERKHIDGLIYRYGMAYPHLRFSLVNDGRLTFQSLGSGKLYDVLIKVYGLEVAQQMLEVRSPETNDSGLVDVYGYISSPSLHRANRSYLTFFVNGRWVLDRMLSYAVSEAYHTLLPTRRHPIVVLRLELDPSQVDINVHPTKSEVRFLDSSAVFTAVQKAVRRTLVDQAAIPRMTDLPSQWPASDMERRRRLVEAGTQAELALEARRAAGIEAPAAFEFPELAKLPPLRVLGQVAQTYIIAEGPEGLYLIDQHTAHERVLYERLMAERAKMAVASQSLLEPLTIELPFQTGGAGGESLELLNQFGFDIEPFGGETYLVRAVPTMLAKGDIGQAIVEIVDGLTEGEAVGTGEERALISLVCHSAVRAGKTLSQSEMRDLIRQLEETAMPRTCPHGRPTMIHLSAEQLAREFGRR
ncbi:MAG: DNA mismatch repair endonuclease MutL [Anaerolineae bacterium]|nr:DNA mismatch repair endonuclease MutL [Anaerolineae bacterium]